MFPHVAFERQHWQMHSFPPPPVSVIVSAVTSSQTQYCMAPDNVMQLFLYHFYYTVITFWEQFVLVDINIIQQ